MTAEIESNDQLVSEMMVRIDAPRRPHIIALSWLAFGLSIAGFLAAFFPWVGMGLAVSKGLIPEGARAFSLFGDPIMIGSLITVPATLTLAIVSIFKPTGRRLTAVALALPLFWPLAMQVLRIYMYDIAR